MKFRLYWGYFVRAPPPLALLWFAAFQKENNHNIYQNKFLRGGGKKRQKEILPTCFQDGHIIGIVQDRKSDDNIAHFRFNGLSECEALISGSFVSYVAVHFLPPT